MTLVPHSVLLWKQIQTIQHKLVADKLITWKFSNVVSERLQFSSASSHTNLLFFSTLCSCNFLTSDIGSWVYYKVIGGVSEDPQGLFVFPLSIHSHSEPSLLGFQPTSMCPSDFNPS